MTDENKRPKVLIVGGGLVGALNALFFARTQKYDIILCEKASDIRGTDRIIGRSINLSLSHRGLTALKIIGLNEKILKASIPMYARMVHGVDEDLTRFPYGSSDQCISAIDRKLMNDILLTEVERNGNIQLFFNMKLINVDFRKKIAKFTTEKGYYEIVFDFLVGNDGAHSTVRQYMSKNIRMDFSEEYIAHGYLEIHFPPGVSKKHLMHKNCLHIWPRNEFMLIGLPNLDGSFTGILFMPFEYYDEIKSNEDLYKFFQFNFPDALRLIGKSNLERMFFANQPAKMVTIRCTPYNFDGLCVIMGDAAHAMVPFYGQGMNSGFEDVIIFHEILQKNDYDLDKTCFEFTKNRNLDAKAMCDLAYFNYEELRINVTLLSFRLRKIIDNFMNYLFPSFWIPLYAMVCFTRIPYTKCLEEKQKQDKILMRLRKMVLSVIFGSLLILTNNVIHNRTAI